MTSPIKFWQVDAFTNTPFKGNPAAVCILHDPISDELMQNIAVEMNLSETAFILIRDGENPLLRWFTPMYEIDLCGHATLASSHIYMTELFPDISSVTFDTKFVGPLTIEKISNGRYTMDFPSRPGEPVDLATIPDFVLDALHTARPIAAFKARDLMLVYEDDTVIEAMSPDFNTLMAYDSFLIVTAPSKNEKHDFISRFFCADDGIAEDPVTGSAHCTSAPYWAERLGKTKLQAYQASKRGGELSLLLSDDRLFMSGDAVSVIRGELSV